MHHEHRFPRPDRSLLSPEDLQGLILMQRMINGELGKLSLEDWTQNSAGDIVKAFDQVREAVLSPAAEVAST
jgi:hypothetical protein